VLSGSFLGNYWLMATEETVTDPAPLPATYHDFRHAVLQATLHLRAGHDVHASADVRAVQADDDITTIEGTVVETKQGVAEPQTNSYPIEHTLVVDIGDRTVSLGGSGSFIEDYETDAVTLSLAE